MKPTLVGSRALNYWCPSFKLREGADWDVITEPEEWATLAGNRYNGSHVEVHNYSELNNREVCETYTSEKNTIEIDGVECFVLEPQGLALMKRSHLWRLYHFEKHITMYHKHLARYALWGDPEWERILKERIKLTKVAYPQRNPDLTQSNMDFFDDNVKKHYDHDWVHEQVAYYERPLFERLKRPDNFEKAWCEKDLWDLLSDADKNRCVAEEAHVIACERFMVPNDWKHPSKLAYFKAVNKVCTTLCSGWFRDHAIDNFPAIIELYNPAKFDKVQKAILELNKQKET